MLRRTLDERERARHWMMPLGRKSASEKVASFLLEMSERLAGRGCHADTQAGFELPFGRQLTKMRADGLLDLPSRREIVINDRAAMEMMAG
ncbi:MULTISPECIES: hypothetical protein [unclassified Sphingopyxis]|uniref:hypothetical protein n=1 Tax=unclassified Sphingopyxis TaxID=2614943 RepID=UPI000B15A7D4|nr:hypothetical protein [Sphingopyxis sp. H100]